MVEASPYRTLPLEANPFSPRFVPVGGWDLPLRIATIRSCSARSGAKNRNVHGIQMQIRWFAARRSCVSILAAFIVETRLKLLHLRGFLRHGSLALPCVPPFARHSNEQEKDPSERVQHELCRSYQSWFMDASA
jgi:hypothetical protein